jgi:phosphatidylinositol-3-phosphatase
MSLLVAALLAAVMVLGPGHPSASQPIPLQRVAVLVLENRSWGEIVGNKQAPYLNSLARQGALATEYYAVAHPSLPNYLALTTGGEDGIKSDCAACRSDQTSLANQLDSAGISWRAYFESIGNPLATSMSRGAAYDPHYNPFAYTDSLRSPREPANVTNFARLRRDLAARKLPRFAWIGLNVRHDGHNEKIPVVDRTARRLVPAIVRSLGPRGALFITWDEGRTSDTREGGGHVPLIVVGPAARAGARLSVRANHYALLRTIEAAFGLPPLGHAADPGTPLLSGLLKPAYPKLGLNP